MKTSLLALRLLTVALATACDRRDDFANALTADAVATMRWHWGCFPSWMTSRSRPTSRSLPNPLPGVLESARMMETQHTDSLIQTKALGPVGDSPAGDQATGRTRPGRTGQAVWQGAPGGLALSHGQRPHRGALALIDGRRLSLASGGAVRERLNKTREHVAKFCKTRINFRPQRLPGLPGADTTLSAPHLPLQWLRLR